MKIFLVLLSLFSISSNAATLTLDCPSGLRANLGEAKITEVTVIGGRRTQAMVILGMKSGSMPVWIKTDTSAAALQLAALLNDDVGDKLHVTLGSLSNDCDEASSYTLKFQN
jgi:hypothetical protein